MKRLRIIILIDAYGNETLGNEAYIKAIAKEIHEGLDEYGYIRELEIREE